MITGAKLIYNKLIQHNVDTAFIYTGGAIMPLVDKFYNNNKIKYYLNTHEQSAGHAATAYARITGKPGISIMTSGPGLTNSVTPLTDATNDSTPLILFTGNVPKKMIGTNAFQECPATEITKPITKWSYLINDINEIPDVVDEAFRISTSGKPGSVHIDIPKCILDGEYNENTNNYIFKKKINNNLDYKYKNMRDYKNNKKIEKIIYNSKRPVLLVGQGCNDYAEELRQFAILSNIPVTTTIHAMGVYDETNKLSLEFVGMHGNIAANYAIQNADLIIALGSRFDDRITGEISSYAHRAFNAFDNHKGGIIHVNKNIDEINKVIGSHYNFNVDCGDFLNTIKPKYNKRTKWFEQIKRWKNKYPFKYTNTKTNTNTNTKTNTKTKIKTQEVLESINKYLYNEKNYIITTGVGNHQMMACQFIKWRYPKSMVTSGSLGVMGVGLPFAIGCQIARPNYMVIDIDGDGSFNHTLSELKTVENYKLPIKIAIMNDGKFSMVKTWEKLFYNERYTATDLYRNPDYVKLAEAYNIKGIMCDKKQDLDNKIQEFLSYDKAILCEFKVESDECLPLVIPGASLHNIKY